MKKILSSLLISSMLVFSGCSDKKNENTIIFGVSTDYPPFEYIEDAQLKGFDIDLANMIGESLNKKVEIKDMQFSNLMHAINSDNIDAAISTITATEERKKHFDFSDPYYNSAISIVYKEASEIEVSDNMNFQGKKIACQLGSVMEIWVNKNLENVNIVKVDHNNQAIESLKSGHVDFVVVDNIQAAEFVSKNPGLKHKIIAKSDEGYAIEFKK